MSASCLHRIEAANRGKPKRCPRLSRFRLAWILEGYVASPGGHRCQSFSNRMQPGTRLAYVLRGLESSAGHNLGVNPTQQTVIVLSKS